MLRPIEGKPEPMTTLEDLLSGPETSIREFIAPLGNNAGRPTLSLTLPLPEASAFTQVYNDPTDPDSAAQRDLNEAHANGLGHYWIHAATVAAANERRRKGLAVPAEYEATARLMGPQRVFVVSPWTANVRDVDPRDLSSIQVQQIAKSNGVALVQASLNTGNPWSLLDGQHRKAGYERAMQFLDYVITTGTYPHGKGRRAFFGFKGPVPAELRTLWAEARLALRKMTVTIELHLGLSVSEERQEFADLNNKSRKVATDLSYQYDRGNAIVVFIQDELTDYIGSGEEGLMSLTELASVNAIAFQNKTNVKGAVPALISERKGRVKEMWEAIGEVDGFGDPDSTVIHQIVVQKAVAKLLYDLAFAKTRTPEERAANDEHVQTLLNNLNDVDFSHSNVLWRIFLMSMEDRNRTQALKGLSAYLPKDENGSVMERDIGVLQNGRFTFSVKHNDVYPVLADMIRFRLRLPSRHA